MGAAKGHPTDNHASKTDKAGGNFGLGQIHFLQGRPATNPKKYPLILFLCAMQPNIRRVIVTRYVTPLREGGSLPAIAEADDGFLYVLKFRGAGQGIKALIAELVGGEIARATGLKLPEIVFAELDEAFGRTEADEEIQDLLKFSTGLNLGLHYLSGAVTYDPAVAKVEAQLASRIVWLDAFLMNVDRTARNTNMLLWRQELWLIDHGAALYFHHSWDNWKEQSARPFAQIKDHVLLPQASAMQEADTSMKALLNKDVIEGIVALIPDEWIEPTFDESAETVRHIYSEFLRLRLENSELFVNQALHARSSII